MSRAMRIWERALLAAAIVWGLALPLLAVVAPLYQGESSVSSSDGTAVTTTSTATLVQVDGRSVLVTVCVPLVVAVVVAVLLTAPGLGRWAVVVASVLTGVLALANLVAMMTIGIFVLPTTGCLIAACVIRLSHPEGRPVLQPAR